MSSIIVWVEQCYLQPNYLSTKFCNINYNHLLKHCGLFPAIYDMYDDCLLTCLFYSSLLKVVVCMMGWYAGKECWPTPWAAGLPFLWAFTFPHKGFFSPIWPCLLLFRFLWYLIFGYLWILMPSCLVAALYHIEIYHVYQYNNPHFANSKWWTCVIPSDQVLLSMLYGYHIK